MLTQPLSPTARTERRERNRARVRGAVLALAADLGRLPTEHETRELTEMDAGDMENAGYRSWSDLLDDAQSAGTRPEDVTVPN